MSADTMHLTEAAVEGAKAAAPSAATVRRRPGAKSVLLDCLMEVADRYCAENATRQAVEIYFELAENHAGTSQAQHARERLMEIAAEYERAGGRRQARGIYERLL